jgi:hypothetical protein
MEQNPKLPGVFVVEDFPSTNGSSEVTFHEPPVLNLSKLDHVDTIESCDKICISPKHTVYIKNGKIYLHKTKSRIKASSSLKDMSILKDSLYILYDHELEVFKIPEFYRIFTIPLKSNTYSKIKFNTQSQELGIMSYSFIDIIQDEKIFMKASFEGEITDCEFLSYKNNCIAAVLSYKNLVIRDYITQKVCSAYESPDKIYKLQAINDNLIALYLQERFCLAFYSYKQETVVYKVTFTSRYSKEFLYCPESAQIILLNKGSKLLLILNINQDGDIYKYIAFSFKCVSNGLKCAYVKNSITNSNESDEDYHKLFVFSGDSVKIYCLNVFKTKGSIQNLDNTEGFSNSNNLREKISNFINSDPKPNKKILESLTKPLTQILDLISNDQIQNNLMKSFAFVEKNPKKLIKFPKMMIKPNKSQLTNSVASLKSSLESFSNTYNLYNLKQCLVLNNKAELLKLIQNNNSSELLSLENSDEFYYKLGSKLLELINDAYSYEINWLEEICYRINPSNENFGFFYSEITKYELEILENSVKILDSKF